MKNYPDIKKIDDLRLLKQLFVELLLLGNLEKIDC